MVALSELAVSFADTFLDQSNKGQLIVTNHEDTPLPWSAEFVSTSINQSINQSISQSINQPISVVVVQWI